MRQTIRETDNQRDIIREKDKQREKQSERTTNRAKDIRGKDIQYGQITDRFNTEKIIYIRGNIFVFLVKRIGTMLIPTDPAVLLSIRLITLEQECQY